VNPIKISYFYIAIRISTLWNRII